MTFTAKSRDPVTMAGVLMGTPYDEARNSACACGALLTQHRILGIWTPAQCPGCAEYVRRSEEREAAEQAGRDRRAKALELLDVPLMYDEATIDSFDLLADGSPDFLLRSRVVQLARRYLGTWDARHGKTTRFDFPHIAVFAGAPGTGKGHIAWAIAKAVATELGDTVKFTVLSDCVRDLREAWNSHDGPSESTRLRAYRSPDLLVIDEVSLHAFHGQPTQHLYDLVAYREQRLRPTIITTNEDKAGLASILGPALVSRLAGFGNAWWDFGSVDYRVHRRKARRGGAA